MITRDAYGRLLAAFKLDRKVSVVARETGVNIRTVIRAWERGWPHMGFRAIKDMVDDSAFEWPLQDDVSARIPPPAPRKDQPTSGQVGRLLSTIDRAIEMELQTATIARMNDLQSTVAIAKLMPLLGPLADYTLKTIREAMETGAYSIDHALRAMAKIVSLQRMTNQARHTAMVVDRLRANQPTAIVEVQDHRAQQITPSDMSIEELQIRLENVAEAIQDAIDGGGMDSERRLTEPVIGQRL